MDYEDMDAKLKANNIHVAIFCSPHNPTGRVWERREIEEAMEVYKNNECVVIADEIWSDLILKGSQHIPTQSISPLSLIHILLEAISCGAVFMGANTYIGNAPNFMVKSMSDENGVRMPSFFGYMAWSLTFLIPVFIIDMLIFFL